MPKISIDNKDYDLDTLPEDAKAQLVSIQYVDAELRSLQLRTAALQTARIAYGRALKQLLEEGASPEEPGVSIEGLGENIIFSE